MKISELSKKHLANNSMAGQIWGALLIRWWFVVLFLLCIIPIVVPCINHSIKNPWDNVLLLAALTFFVLMLISVFQTLTSIFNLKKKETGITWCQISILIAIGFWIVGFVLIVDIKENNKVAAAIGIVGMVLSLIFQDKIKGVAAFLHLRMHHLLNIDDWIQVPKYNVDGEIKRVTLTTVTIYNWDTTTSIIPISALQSEHFINLQKMVEGKTYGRKMCKNFLLDTGYFRQITAADVDRLKEFKKKNNDLQWLPEDEIKEGAYNAYLYRIYIYHWLMNQPHVSQQPRLIVRWMEQETAGMPLQVYAFIIDSSLAAFEWEQSKIIEHIIKSLDWFGLMLYQSPSGYDVTGVNVCMTEKPSTHIKEIAI